jgi:hypothetical protein
VTRIMHLHNDYAKFMQNFMQSLCKIGALCPPHRYPVHPRNTLNTAPFASPLCSFVPPPFPTPLPSSAPSRRRFGDFGLPPRTTVLHAPALSNPHYAPSPRPADASLARPDPAAPGRAAVQAPPEVPPPRTPTAASGASLRRGASVAPVAPSAPGEA